MHYRDDNKAGRKLSALGFGCMRFPKEQSADELVLRALDLGINYFDTAYAYPGNEETLGRIMARHGLRDRMLLATKLPHGKCRTLDDVERIFSTSLARLQTDHVEYYLIHNVVEKAQWDRLVDLGIVDWIAQAKQQGRIGSIGFSFHGTQPEFLALLDAYPWDFCQIQYNYANEHFQAGRVGLEAAAARDIPVIIMEPLLGGRLVTGLPKAAAAALHQADPQASLASWGLQWLWDQPGVTCVLSGMNTVSQLEDNAQVADATLPNSLDIVRRQALDQAKAAFQASFKVGCTGCNYCMPCPRGINIPAAFTAYNQSFALGWFNGVYAHMMSAGVTAAEPHLLANCTQCGACARKCPQHIDVPKQLRSVQKRLEPAVFRPAVKVISKVSNKSGA